jgi:DNA repair protein RadC
VELIALLIRAGGKTASSIDLSRYIINQFGGLKELLAADLQELTRTKDIGIAKASALKATLEIALRLQEPSETQNIKVRKPKDIFRTTRKDLFGKSKEYLYLLSLDTKNKLLGKDLITIGSNNETHIHTREIYRQALTRNAVSIALVHNHPSEDTTPSSQDIKVTKKIAKVGEHIGIPLLDHLVVTDNTYTSIKSLSLMHFKQNKEVRHINE